MKKARVIMDGESQLVELPEDCHIDAEEVSVVKEGDVVLLIPKATDWKTFFAAIDMFTDDFMMDESVENMKKGIVSEPVGFDKLP